MTVFVDHLRTCLLRLPKQARNKFANPVLDQVLSNRLTSAVATRIRCQPTSDTHRCCTEQQPHQELFLFSLSHVRMLRLLQSRVK